VEDDKEKFANSFRYAMEHTKTLVPVRQTLFTFAPTDIRYSIITQLLNDAGVEMRQGKLTVERPAIITPSAIFERLFEGFESDQREYLDALLKTGGLRGLQYKFKNETESVETRQEKLETLAERLKQEAQARPLSRMAVIQGVPDMWSLSLMKCTMEMTDQSFPGNIKDLEEHGWFNK
jgi:hypothetical protein